MVTQLNHFTPHFFCWRRCFFCRTELEFLAEHSPLLGGLGADVIAVSTVPDDELRKYAEGKNISFTFIGGDHGLQVIQDFGLSFDAPPQMVEAMNLKEYFQCERVVLPVAAAYVITTDGKVSYAYLEENPGFRANLNEVAAAVVRAQTDREKYLTKVRTEEVVPAAEGEVAPAGAGEPGPAKPKKRGFFARLFSRKKKTATAATGKGTTLSGSVVASSSKSSAVSSDPTKPVRAKSIVSKVTNTTGGTTGTFLEHAFAYCLENEEFLAGFSKYLELTFCSENLLFFMDATTFANEYEAHDQAFNTKMALTIMQTFVETGSPLEINIDDKTHEHLIERAQKKVFEAQAFEAAAREVYQLMESDSFPKWRRTKEFVALWEKAGRPEDIAPHSSYLPSKTPAADTTSN